MAEAIDSLAGRLRTVGLANERREARLILGAALGLGPAAVIGYPERVLQRDELDRLAALLKRRLELEPLSRIVGLREFWSLSFRVTEATLDPRPDSETVVDAALALVADRRLPLRILDLGTGSGCLLLALLAELPAARGLGVDCDPAAVATARLNAERLGLADRAAFAQDDWGRGQTGDYHLIVSNPPYIPTPDLDTLPPEVIEYDPVLALDGGRDGLHCFRALAPEAVRLLGPGGTLVVEIGLGQEAPVEEILERAGLLPCGRRRDLAGRVRCVAARKPQAVR
jgi:release factor glutamine methyltransferase